MLYIFSISFFIGNFLLYLINIDLSYLYNLQNVNYKILIGSFLLVYILIKLIKDKSVILFLTYKIIFFILLGMLFNFYNISKYFSFKIPGNLVNNKVTISGTVVSFIDKKQKYFYLKLDYIIYQSKKYKFDNQKKILIKDYNQKKVNLKLDKYHYGDQLILEAKLKKIFNKKLYNYYFSNNIIAEASLIDIKFHVINTNYFSFNYIRNYFYQNLVKLTDRLENKYLIYGLILGDKSNISKEHKLLFQNTGVSHLPAISGMHLSAVYLLGIYFFKFIWNIFYEKLYYIFFCAKNKFEALGGVVFISFYGVLSGFSIPTIRAFIFLLLYSSTKFFSYKINKLSIIAIALIIIVFFEPFCYLDIGFWLSFSMIFMLFYILNNIDQYNSSFTFRDNYRHKILNFFRLPFSLFIFSIPMTLLFFEKVPIVTSLVNLIVIPLINFAVLPLLISSLLFIYNISIAKFLLYLADLLLSNFIYILNIFDVKYFINLKLSWESFFIATSCCLLLFMPRKLPGKLLASIAFSLILFKNFYYQEKSPNNFIDDDKYIKMSSEDSYNFVSKFYG